MNTVLTTRLQLMFEWYRNMINMEIGRVRYMYYPQLDLFSEDSSPIREIASIWDMEILSDFLHRTDLQPIIDRSLQYFSSFCSLEDGYMVLNPKKLGEPSSIAHSAFMILAFVYSKLPEKWKSVAPLSEGILKQQRTDGSYKIYFGDVPDSGLEFYPAEAMLALLEAYASTNDVRYLESAEKGLQYYKSKYYDKGMVQEDFLVFFANWQSQFCLQLFRSTPKNELREGIKNYVFNLHDRIIWSGFYREIEAHPERQSTVEVACAAEGLNDTYTIALDAQEQRMVQYRDCLCSALSYLLDAECVDDCTQKERGGFGFSLSNRTQRIDVTGHVMSAFIKSIKNKVAC